MILCTWVLLTSKELSGIIFVDEDHYQGEPYMNKRIRKKHEKNLTRHRCLCCGNYTLIGSEMDIMWYICPVCYWENDTKDNDDEDSGANGMTLGEGKTNYKKFGACDEKMLPHVRKPKKCELPENNVQK